MFEPFAIKTISPNMEETLRAIDALWTTIGSIQALILESRRHVAETRGLLIALDNLPTVSRRPSFAAVRARAV